MFREQMINFLQTAVVFLLMTNVTSVLATTYAIRLRKALLDPYRPERHYMRGPGPKWRERHADAGGERIEHRMAS
jgi:hypothetical protein